MTDSSAGPVLGREATARALATAGVGTWEWNVASGWFGLDSVATHLLEMGDEGFEGSLKELLSRFPESEVGRVEDALEEGLREGEIRLEVRLGEGQGKARWVGFKGRLLDDCDEEQLAAGIVLDLADQAGALEGEREARRRAEKASERLRLLADASSVFGSPLEYRRRLEEVARLCVPRLADWCEINMLTETGSLEPIVAVHNDPQEEKVIRTLRRKYPLKSGEESLLEKVVNKEQPLLLPQLTPELIRQLASGPDHLERLLQLQLGSSMIIVPLRSRGRILGTLTLISSQERGRYDAEDFAFAQDLARRCAVAIDNARLYEERTRIANTLEQSLLPRMLAPVPGMDAACSYTAAGEPNEVGGDFYDLFEIEPGSWGFMIGDVLGKGAEAASLAGLARHTVKAAAFQGDEPRRVLKVVNAAILKESRGTRFCTMVYGRIRKSNRFELEIACAGHPRPLLLRPGGEVRSAGGQGDLLGVFEEVAVDSEVVSLAPGETLVLYTDGVTEAQGPGDAFGEERLQEVLAEVEPERAQDLVTALEQALEAYMSGPPRDDRALLVLLALPEA